MRGVPKIDRIVVLKVDHIGDFVLALSSLHALRCAAPNEHIALVCSSAVRDFAHSTQIFNETIEFDFFNRDAAARGVSYHTPYASIADVVSDHYELAIDLRHDADTRPLLDHLRVKTRAGYEAKGLRHPLDLSLPRFADWRLEEAARFVPHAETRLKLLMTAVIDTFFARPVCRAEQVTGTSRPSGGGGRAYFVLAPGSGNTLKNWGVHNFSLLGRKLCRELNMRCVVIGSPAEQPAAKLIAAALPVDRCTNLVGKSALTDLPDLLRGASLFVGNDSGPTHLSASVGTPTVCIFSGVADLHVWRPRGPNVSVVRIEQPCSPCYLPHDAECAFGRACTEDVPLAAVAAACEQVLGDHAAASAPQL